MNFVIAKKLRNLSLAGRRMQLMGEQGALCSNVLVEIRNIILRCQPV